MLGSLSISKIESRDEGGDSEELGEGWDAHETQELKCFKSANTESCKILKGPSPALKEPVTAGGRDFDLL